ncbi:MAG TPA: fructosamine kinase family protein, partial [Methylobacter sp.]
MNWHAIVQQIESATGQPFRLTKAWPLSGGDINAAYRLQGDNVSFFVKLNTPDRFSMFEAEAAGLEALNQAQAIRVPKFIACGQTPDYAFLVLEYIDLHR